MIRVVLVTFAMACLTGAAIMSTILLSLLVGRERAMYRIGYALGRLLEWLSGEGPHRKASDEGERA